MMVKNIRPLVLLQFWVILSFGAAAVFAEQKPDWVDGASLRYPEQSHLSAVGFGDDRQAAESNAYGAIARIFRSDIQSVTHEAERFRQREGSGQNAMTDRTVDIQSQTAVRSKIALEQVQIVAHWVDPKSKVHYALAALNRSQAAQSLRQKLLEAESEAKTWEARSREAKRPLLSVKALHKAVLASSRGDEYRMHLRVIDLSGGGFSKNAGVTADLQNQLSALLNEHFQVAVELKGPHAEDVKTTLLEGLNQKGLTSGPNAKLIIRGVIRFEKTGPKSPVWHFVRWSTRMTLTEKESGQVFGTIRRTGREGQLSPETANEKALAALQTELREGIEKSVFQFIFGE